MTLRPFISYYGGKWSLAPKYPAPLHDTIVEPFAGSAGYSTRHHDRQVILVDTSEQVAGVWAYLIGSSRTDIERLPLLEVGQRADELSVCQEARWLIGWWVNKGAATPHQTLSAWAREPQYASQFWGAQIRTRIARQVEHIKHWRVVHGDWRDLADCKATWFVDPPYDNRAGRRYPHHDIDYLALAEWCKSRGGQVIACEQTGADWLPFVHLADAKAMEGSVRTGRSAEAVWIGGSRPTSPEVLALTA